MGKKFWSVAVTLLACVGLWYLGYVLIRRDIHAIHAGVIHGHYYKSHVRYTTREATSPYSFWWEIIWTASLSLALMAGSLIGLVQTVTGKGADGEAEN